MLNNKQFKILYLIQLPPPVHGVSLMNHYVSSSKKINEGFNIEILRLHFSVSIDELRKKHFKKFILSFRHLFHLVVTLVKFKPDLVYFSLIPVGIGFLRDLIFVTALKISSTNLLYHLHNRGIAHYAQKGIWRKLYEYAFGNTNIIHVSEGLLKHEIEILDLKNTKTFIVGNTIKPVEITRKEKTSGPIELIFLSNYLPEKGLMVLLEAFARLKKDKYNVKLNTYGSTFQKEEDAKYIKYIQENDLVEYVNFNGPVFNKEKYEILANTDIFIFPSYFSEECFPLSLLEAMHAGLPIIATKIGAIPEIIEDGKEGLLVEPKDIVKISEKVIQLINDPDLRIELGRNALKKFEEKYAYSKFEKQMERIFTELVNEKPGV